MVLWDSWPSILEACWVPLVRVREVHSVSVSCLQSSVSPSRGTQSSAFSLLLLELKTLQTADTLFFNIRVVP